MADTESINPTPPDAEPPIADLIDEALDALGVPDSEFDPSGAESDDANPDGDEVTEDTTHTGNDAVREEHGGKNDDGSPVNDTGSKKPTSSPFAMTPIPFSGKESGGPDADVSNAGDSPPDDADSDPMEPENGSESESSLQSPLDDAPDAQENAIAAPITAGANESVIIEDDGSPDAPDMPVEQEPQADAGPNVAVRVSPDGRRISEIPELPDVPPEPQPDRQDTEPASSLENRALLRGHGTVAAPARDLFISRKRGARWPLILFCLWIIAMGAFIGGILRNIRNATPDEQSGAASMTNTGDGTAKPIGTDAGGHTRSPGRPFSEWEIISQPPGAVVTVNGRFIITTRNGLSFPAVTPLRLPVDSPLISSSGKVLVELERDGYRPHAFTFSITDKRIPPQTLTPIIPASLHVTSDPSQAEVLIDGALVGETPLTFDSLSPGEHEIIVRKINHSAMHDRIIATSGARLEIQNVKLEDLILRWLTERVQRDEYNIQSWSDLAHYRFITNHMQEAADAYRRGLQLAVLPFIAPADATREEITAQTNKYKWSRDRVRADVHKKMRQGQQYYSSDLNFALFRRLMEDYKRADNRREQILRDWKRTLKKGREMTFNNDARQAAFLYGDFLRYHPGDYRAYAGLARAQLFDGDYGKSMDSLKKALELQPSNLRFRYLLAQYHRQLADTPEFGVVAYNPRQLWQVVDRIFSSYTPGEAKPTPEIVLRSKLLHALALAKLSGETAAPDAVNEARTRAMTLLNTVLAKVPDGKLDENARLDIADIRAAVGQIDKARAILRNLSASAESDTVRGKAKTRLEKLDTP